MQAVVNVTYGGQNGEMPDQVFFDKTDDELIEIVQEALQGGGIPGIDMQPNADLEGFVVERYNAEDDLPNRFMVRPKVPFG